MLLIFFAIFLGNKKANVLCRECYSQQMGFLRTSAKLRERWDGKRMQNTWNTTSINHNLNKNRPFNLL